ncbi:MAG: hypothetical protein Q7U70_10760 [Methylotenera sp.]|nr:hypothetical protein [Methylotenera sp.]
MDRKRLGIFIIICSFVATIFIRDFAATAFLIVSAVIMGNLYLDSKESERKSRQEEHVKSLEYRDRLVREAREQGKAEAEAEAKNAGR